METIERAAILQDGIVHSSPAPGRHHNVIHYMFDIGLKLKNDHTQGFLTSTGRFVDRKEAAIIARAAGQVPKKKLTNPQDTLFSEDVW